LPTVHPVESHQALLRGKSPDGRRVKAQNQKLRKKRQKRNFCDFYESLAFWRITPEEKEIRGFLFHAD